MYHFKEREKFTKAAKYFEEYDYDLRFISQIAFPSPAKNGGLLINFLGIERLNHLGVMTIPEVKSLMRTSLLKEELQKSGENGLDILELLSKSSE